MKKKKQVVFKRLNKSWMVDDILLFAKNFYDQQAQLLGEQFYFNIPIYKIFSNQKEQEFWLQKSNEPQLFDWINPEIEYPFDSKLLHHPSGAAKTLQSGFLNTANWLEYFKNHLKNNDAYKNEKFSYNDIELTDTKVKWKGYEAKGIIFCEGYQSTNNPYFDWLPLRLTKGELLTVTFENLILKEAINKGVFILPVDGGYKLGATYDWGNQNEIPTLEGREELLEKAKKFIKTPIHIIKHQAGIRPTVIDRRPLIGTHPKHHQLSIFNGLGTKGVMLAPYFAHRLSQQLINKEVLPSDVDIQRFQDDLF